MASGKVTTNHDEIKRFVEKKGGWPAHVIRTGGKGDPGLLRIDYPGYSGQGKLERISWDEFFEKFDESKLALIYQDEPDSRFTKLVSRASVAEKAKRAGGRGTGRSAGRASTAKKTTGRSTRAARTKKTASKTRTAAAGKRKTTAKQPKRAAAKSAGTRTTRTAAKAPARKSTAKKSATGRKTTQARKSTTSAKTTTRKSTATRMRRAA